MKIVFRIDKDISKDEDNIVVTALFPSEDTTYHQTGLCTIMSVLEGLVDELNADENKEISFISLYAGSEKFCDTFHNESFDILVRMVNGIPNEIIRMDEYISSDFLDLLNQENTDEKRKYQIFKVRGKLD